MSCSSPTWFPQYSAPPPAVLISASVQASSAAVSSSRSASVGVARIPAKQAPRSLAASRPVRHAAQGAMLRTEREQTWRPWSSPRRCQLQRPVCSIELPTWALEVRAMDLELFARLVRTSRAMPSSDGWQWLLTHCAHTEKENCLVRATWYLDGHGAKVGHAQKDEERPIRTDNLWVWNPTAQLLDTRFLRSSSVQRTALPLRQPPN